MKYIAYTDGSSRGNPGPAGWSAIIMNDDHVREYNGHEPLATNNQMELMGVVFVLKFILTHVTEKGSGESAVIIFSDSKYVVDGATSWIYSWVRNNWKSSTKKDVLNKEIWMEMWSSISSLKLAGVTIKFEHVRGHNGNIYNERADQLCTSSALKIDCEKYNSKRLGYDEYISKNL
jgi:ribonuclease HI